jgi:aspartyl-tRNA(Asn)/glutamyl-tRNA(Gln) amidotransferase subunit A
MPGARSSTAESFAWHRELLATRAAEYDPRVRTRIEIGATQTAADYIAAARRAQQIYRQRRANASPALTRS